MAVRAFLCPWTEQALPGGGLHIRNPISDYFENVSLSDASAVFNYFYARMSAARRPDKLYMITAIRGNLTSAEWTAIDAIAGVHMMPPGAFDKNVSSLNSPTRNKIYTALDSLGVPRTALDSAATVGGFLRNVLAELDPGNVSFGAWEMLPAEWA